MEWTSDQIFEFLSYYQQEPALWDLSAPEHKNRNNSYDAWNRIKSKLNVDGTITIKELKKKRDNLMATYRKQRTKVRLSESRNDDTFIPEWPFYKVMSSFLDDVYKPRKKVKNRLLSVGSKQIRKTEDNEQQGTKKRKEHPHSDRLNIDYMKVLHTDKKTPTPNDINSNKGSKLTRDEYTTYGELVAMKLRKIDNPYARSTVQHHINTILYKAEIGKYDRNQGEQIYMYQSDTDCSRTEAASTQYDSSADENSRVSADFVPKPMNNLIKSENEDSDV